MYQAGRSGFQTLIVSTAQAVAESEQVPVAVVGKDTDLLLAAPATTSIDMHMLCRSNPVTVFNIHEIQHAIGDTRNCQMFIYAVTGCDTVSAIYRQGSRKTFNMVHKKLDYDLLDTFAVEAPMTRVEKRAGKPFMGPAVLNILMTTATLHTIKRAIGPSSLSSSFQKVYLQLVLQQSNIHTAPILQSLCIKSFSDRGTNVSTFSVPSNVEYSSRLYTVSLISLRMMEAAICVCVCTLCIRSIF